jgi:Fe-S-cluster containining protein
MKIAGTQFHLKLSVPTAPVPPGAVLPVLHAFSEAIEADVSSNLEAQGKRVSCRAGCGACCRQLVPITEIEARDIAELVDTLPEERQTEIKRRFAEASRRLDEAGLLDILRHLDRVNPENRQALGLDYFSQGIPCPFLENGSCSIHSQRPLICREYLVTSPAEHCANPAAERVEGVKLPVRLTEVLARLPGSSTAGASPRVVLALALEWAANHPGVSPARPGPEWVTRLLKLLSGRELPEPTGE